MVSVGPRANRLPRESQKVLKRKEKEREIPVERLGHLPRRRSAKSATRRAIPRPSASKGSSWAETKTKSGGPRLRDAQGQEIKHESRYRKVRLCLKAITAKEIVAEVNFLIGPVQQPILSMGKLEHEFKPELDTKERVMRVKDNTFALDCVMRSYHLPAWVAVPEDERVMDQVRQIKRIVVEQNSDLVKFKPKLKSELVPWSESRREKLRQRWSTGTRRRRRRNRNLERRPRFLRKGQKRGHRQDRERDRLNQVSLHRPIRRRPSCSSTNRRTSMWTSLERRASGCARCSKKCLGRT